LPAPGAVPGAVDQHESSAVAGVRADAGAGKTTGGQLQE